MAIDPLAWDVIPALVPIATELDPWIVMPADMPIATEFDP
jgi:hypothetical protein